MIKPNSRFLPYPSHTPLFDLTKDDLLSGGHRVEWRVLYTRETEGNKGGTDVEQKIWYLADTVAKREAITSEIMPQMSYKYSHMTGQQEEITRWQVLVQKSI
jgi:hypothetical protein